MIDNINIPEAAGINTSGGDVRHFGPSDPVDSDHITAATRNLAYRDTMLASKINELVGAVNNQAASIVPIVIPSVTLAPGEEIQIGNFRIPSSYEAGIINASVASSIEGMIGLDVEYSSGTFGSSSGTSVATVLPGGELTAEGPYYQTGELIFNLTNVGAVSCSTIASLIIKIRKTA